jgi:hypothetical protein
VISNVSNDLPAASSSAESIGRTTSSRYFRVAKLCSRTLSAIRAAVFDISGPTAANAIGTIGNSSGPGENSGVIRVKL